MSTKKLIDLLQKVETYRSVVVGGLVALLILMMLSFFHNSPSQAGTVDAQAIEFETLASESGETVERFFGDIEILENDAARVTLMIQAKSAGVRFFKGIAPGVPTGRRYADGSVVEYTIESISATRNDEPENHEIRNSGEFSKRIFVFNPEKDLEPGSHTYVINYILKGAITSSAGKKRLQWQGLYPFWSLPVDSLALRIRLPINIDITSVDGHASLLSPDGTQEDALSKIEPENNGLLFWPKGRNARPLSSFQAKVEWPA